jgi:glycerol-3-phosphate dehydrogenase
LEAEGVTVRYRESGQERRCRAQVLVNAAGPWVAAVDALVAPFTSSVQSDLVQGTHILVDIPAQEGIFYMEVPADGRAVFLMPWKGMSLVGTTENPFAGREPAATAPSDQEQEYLRKVVEHYFPGRPFKQTGAFAGLRVLPRDAARPFDRGRELILGTDRGYKPRVISLYGGKLTSYRADSLKVIRKIRGALPTRQRRGDTAELHLQPVD